MKPNSTAQGDNPQGSTPNLLDDLDALCDQWYVRLGDRRGTYAQGQWVVLLEFTKLCGEYRKHPRPGDAG